MTSKVKKALFWLNYWFPPMALMVIIFYLSSRPTFIIGSGGWQNFIFFKSLHFLEYALLFVLLYRAIKTTITKNKLSSAWGAGIIAFFWAVIDEIHQLYVPTRSGTLRDILIDSLGICFGLILLWIILPKAPKKLRTWAEKLALI